MTRHLPKTKFSVFLRTILRHLLYYLKYCHYLARLLLWKMRFNPQWRKATKIAGVSAVSIALLASGISLYRWYSSIPRAPKLEAASSDSPYLFQARGKEFQAQIGKKKTNVPAVEFSVGDSKIAFSPASGKPLIEEPVKEEKKLTFKNVYSNIDFVYQTTPKGIKEDIVIRQAQEIRTFPFLLEFKGAAPQYVTENLANRVFYDAQGNYLFHFEKPYAEDAAGSRSDKVQLLVKRDINSGKYAAIVSLDPDWLSSPSRVYPVFVDPSIVHDTSSEFATGQFNRVKDTGSGASPNLETFYQELPADEHTVGLWHMNETADNTCTGGVNDVCDSSGNGNDGAATGTTIDTTNQRLGDAARTFNGSSDFINVGDISLLESFPVTVEAWVKTSSATDQTIYSEGNTSVDNAFGRLQLESTGKVRWNFENGASSLALVGDTVINDGSWHHVVGVSESTTSHRVYVDGKLDGSSTTSFTPATTHNSANIGRLTRLTPIQYFNGTIDEIRLSNRALSPEEIKLNAQRRPYSIFASASIDLGANLVSLDSLQWTELGVQTGDGETLSDSTSLVAQWNLNETSGTTAANAAGSCGASCNGTLTNFANTSGQDVAPSSGWTAVNHKWGAGALMFDGSNDFVTMGNPASLQFERTDTFSLETWFVYLGDDGSLIGKHQSDGNNMGYTIMISGGKLHVRIIGSNGAGITFTGGTSLQQGTYYHAVLTYDGSSTLAGTKLYLNGIQETKNTTTDALTTSIATSAHFEIGARGASTGSGADNPTKANVDSSRVYSRVLTASEILSNYQAGNIEFQTRTSADNSTWEAWKPTTNETQIDSLGGETSSWQYRKPITITNGGTSLTEFQVLVKVDTASLITAGKLQSDCDDIRFTNSSGRMLSFFQSTACNASTTRYWVKVDSIPTPSATIYMFYGNPSASSASDRDATLDLSVLGTFSQTYSDANIASNHGASSDRENNFYISQSTYVNRFNTSWTFQQQYSGLDIYTGICYDDKNDRFYGIDWTNKQWSTFSTSFVETNPQDQSLGDQPIDCGTDSVYVYTNHRNGLIKRNKISDNTSSSISMDALSGFDWGGQGLSYAFGYLFAGTSGSYGANGNRIYVINIDDWSNPRIITFWDTSGHTLTEVAGIAWKGKYIYQTSRGEDAANEWQGPVKVAATEPTVGAPGTEETYASHSGSWIQAVADWTSSYKKTLSNTQDSAIKVEGTDSMKVKVGQPQIDAYTAGLWHMEETSGSGAYIKDSTANANHGTPTGTSVVDGFYGKARKFSSGDYVNFGDIAVADFGTANFTVEFWFKSPDVTGSTYLLSKRSACGHQNFWNIYLISSGAIGVELDQDAGGTNYNSFSSNATGLDNDAWHHVAVTRSDVTASIYIDGVFDKSNSTAGTTNLSNTNNFTFAQNPCATVFGGKLDEVRISNAVRSAEEIAEAWRAGRDHRLSRTVTSTDLSAKGKLPFWVAADRPGTYLQATIGEGAFANYEPDANTKGLWHLDDDGSLSGGEYVTNSSGYPTTQLFAGISGGWAATACNDTSSNQTSYLNQYPSPGDSFGGKTWQTSTDSDGNFNWDSVICGGDCTNTYSYSHIYLYSPSDQTIRFKWGSDDASQVWVNGVLKSTVSTCQGVTIDQYQVDTSVNKGWNRILWRVAEGGGGYGLAWRVTDTSNNALRMTYRVTKPKDIKDSSSSANDGLNAGADFTQGKIGKARSFNGSSNYINAGSGSSFNINTAITLEAWVKLGADTSAMNTILSNADGSLGNGGYRLQVGETTSNKPEFELSLASWTQIVANTALTTNNWYHIAATYDGSTMKLYINGVLDASQAASGSIVNPNTATRIGANYYAGLQAFFNGTIDEVRISNTARTADEIRQIYEMGVRSHSITVDFAAKGDSGNLITGSGDTSFTVDATAYGLNSKGSNLFETDKIIVRENVDGTEYLAQGDVTAVTASTGAVTVDAWDSGSTFPTGGYTANATFFKWQRENFDITGPLDAHINATTRLTVRATSGSEGRTVWLDDFESAGDYLTTPGGSTITSTVQRYFQYRAILSSSDTAVSPSVTSVTLDYTDNVAPNTPTLDSPANTATGVSLTPALKTTATDNDSNNLQYKIELDTVSTFDSGNLQTFDQTASQTGWSGQNADAGTTYTSGTQATYTVQSALSAGTTYYWRSYAIDPAGSNTFGSTQGTPFSFTTSQTPTAPTSLLTEGQTNPTDVIDLTPEFSAIYNDPDTGDIANYYQVQVNTRSDFTGTSMWNSGQTSMTNTTQGTRTPDISYAGTALSLDESTFYWRIRLWDDEGNVSPYSATAQFTMANLVAPTSCRLQEAVDDSSITVVWTDTNSVETGYEVERSVNAGAFANITTTAANATSHQDTGVSQGNTYQYRVRAAESTSGSTSPYCTTATLSLQSGTFELKGVNLKGVNLK